MPLPQIGFQWATNERQRASVHTAVFRAFQIDDDTFTVSSGKASIDGPEIA